MSARQSTYFLASLISKTRHEPALQQPLAEFLQLLREHNVEIDLAEAISLAGDAPYDNDAVTKCSSEDQSELSVTTPRYASVHTPLKDLT